MPEKVKGRYTELLETVFTADNVRNVFQSFSDMIPENIADMERMKWSDKPSIYENNIDQIVDYAQKRFDYINQQFR